MKAARADSEATVQAAGRPAPPGNAWKREHESTFLDSDWPRFNNTAHALSISFHSVSLSLCAAPPPPPPLPLPNKSCAVNIKVVL